MREKIQHKGVVVVILATTFLFSFSQFLLITAYPVIMKEFSINATQVQWLTTSFLLTTIVLIPTTGYLSDRFSSKSLVIFALSCLVIGTVVGGFSINFTMLISSRVIQAIGAGIILPLVQTVLLTVFPYERRGFAMGLIGGVVNVAPASAPPISGMIIDLFSWRSLHWALLPLIVIALLLAVFLMKDVLKKQESELDIYSIVLAAIGFSFFVFGLSNISVYGFTHMLVLLPIVIGVVGVFVFVRRQLSLRIPVLNVRLFQNPIFRLAQIIIFINMMLLLSMETILPMFAQDVLLTSAFLSGFIMVPGTLILSIVTIISGNLYDRYGGRKLVLIGFLITLLAVTLMSMVGLGSSPYLIMFYFCIFMAGFGCTLMPLVTVSMNAIANHDIPHGSAIVNTSRQFGMTFGVVVLTSIISITNAMTETSYQIGTYKGATYAFVTMAILAFSCMVMTMFLREKNVSSKIKQAAVRD